MDSKSTFHYVKKLIKVYYKAKNNHNQTMPNPIITQEMMT